MRSGSLTSIEDIAQLKAGEDFGNVRISSPRTAEACLRLGFTLSELLPRLDDDDDDDEYDDCDVGGVKGGNSSFHKSGSKIEKSRNAHHREKKSFRHSKFEYEEMVKAKWEHHESRRKFKIDQISQERNRIARGIENGRKDAKQEAQERESAKLQKEKAVEEEAKAIKAGVLEMEEKRMLSIKKRQESEMLRAMEGQRRMVELQAKLLHAEEQDRKRAAEFAKRVADQKAAAAEKARKIAAEKKLAEDEEDRRRHEMYAAEKKVQMRLLEEEKALAKVRAAEARQREIERQEKIEAQQRATEALAKQKEEQLMESRAVMEAREQRARDQLEEKRVQRHKDIEERRKKAVIRVQSAIERAEQVQVEKKNKYYKKQDQVAARKAEKETEEQAHMQKRIAMLHQKEEQRQKRLYDSYMHRADHKEDIVKKGRERQKFYGVVRAQREREAAMRNLQKELGHQDRLENIERIKRVNEFYKLNLHNKIEEETNRCELVKEQRQFLIEQRRKAALQASMQKHRMKEEMEKMRVSNKFQETLLTTTQMTEAA